MGKGRASMHALHVGNLSLEHVTSATKKGGTQILAWPGSWIWNEKIAIFLWSVDENVVGSVPSESPSLYIRVLYTCSYAALWLLLFLSMIYRLTMRLLLQYHNWMYEHRPSITTMIWGAIMKVFLLGKGKNALMYSFKHSMPRLPVPPLEKTISKYLRSVEPLLSKAEFAEVQKEALAFLRRDGSTLQCFLICKSWLMGNYVSDWWEKYIYLRSRAPILINSNYYGLGYAYHIPSHVQTARAGALVHFYLRFKELLDSGKLPLMTIRGTVPLCMRQFERMFATTRVPGRDIDTIMHGVGQTTTHVAVIYKGTYWRLDAIADEGRLLEPYLLQDQFDMIVNTVDSMEVSGLRLPASDDPEGNLPALTALNRTCWAKIREDFFGIGLNRMSLEEIESAMFVVNLDDRSPTTWTDLGKLSLDGSGTTRWCDKSFSLIVFANGNATFHAEHSWADAPVTAYAWEWVHSYEDITPVYDKTGHCLRPIPATSSFLATSSGAPITKVTRGPVRLQWLLEESVREMIREAMLHAKALCDDLDLVVDCFEVNSGGYGKGLIKEFKCGPDAWIQLALQLAYFRDQGHLDLTYESASTRLFNEGRTETIRSVSKESTEFVQIFTDTNATNQEKIQALQKAAEGHQKTSRDASCGKGVDRHLFALYVASMGMGKDVKFLKEALSIPWRLSTSQIPQRQTEGIIGKLEEYMICPSGGFGPVSDDGYGVSYMMASDSKDNAGDSYQST